MRILIVEDDPDLSRQLGDALKDQGYAVDVAGDGEEGHFLGDTEPYDAVILDLGLPLIDGVSVLQKWRSDGKTFPVIILTARDQWSEKVAIEIGDLLVDNRAARAFVDGSPIKLTSHEFRLISYLAMHRGRVISRTELVEHIYDQDFDRDSNTIEVFVGRLRRKIGTDRIETVRGLGYRLVNPAETKAK